MRSAPKRTKISIPQDDELVVKAHAASVDAIDGTIDWKMRSKTAQMHSLSAGTRASQRYRTDDDSHEGAADPGRDHCYKAFDDRERGWVKHGQLKAKPPSEQVLVELYGEASFDGSGTG